MTLHGPPAATTLGETSLVTTSQVDDGVISDRDTLVDVNAYTDPDAISSERPLARID